MQINPETAVAIPISVLIGFLVSFAAFIAGGVWWIASTFYRKSEARELEKRVTHMDGSLQKVAMDTSYIRGVIDIFVSERRTSG